MALRENNALIFLILLGISFVLFGQILNNDFWTREEFEYLANSLVNLPADMVFSESVSIEHPLVNMFHRFEYLLFGDKPMGYYLLNIFIHAINAFLLYLLIYQILKGFGIAFLSSVMFACAVGNFGKEVMYAAGVSGILMHTVFLLTVLCYVMNEIKSQGKIVSFWFLATLFFFTISIVNRFAFFSGVGVLLAYNVFFRRERERPVFALPILLLLVFGSILTGFQWESLKMVTNSYPEGWGAGFFLGNFFKNIPAYLIHMFYPAHYTELVQGEGFLSTLYSWNFWIRPLLGVIIFAYAAYGFVFGNTSLRFFIAWTVVTILPFCFFHMPGDWLNTKYLYLSSVGLCLILATGTMKMYGVLVGRGRRRFLPFVIPAIFIMSVFVIVDKLDKAYEYRSKQPETLEFKARFLEMKRQSLQVKD
ncbi:MAG: hypothetical protein GY835_26015 [bacterium]|nr:hypothetical protein [bacterium]